MSNTADDTGAARGLLDTYPVLGWRQHIWLIVVSVGLFALDFVTKQWALHHLNPAHPVSIIDGWAQLTLVRNPGAAFSMGEGFTVAFAALGLAAVVVLVVLVAPRADGRLSNIVVGMLLAGVAGNLSDRVFRAPAPFHGWVVDWINLRFFVCNLADVCITATAVVIVVALLRVSKQRA